MAWGIAVQVGAIFMRHEIPIMTFDPEGRAKFTPEPGCSHIFPLLAVPCRARSCRWRSLIVAMVLRLSVARQPRYAGRENERALGDLCVLLCVPIQDVGWALKLLSETPEGMMAEPVHLAGG